MAEKGTPVIILCGGTGSRLWPLTDLFQKALVSVAGKPCVRWIIQELQSQGFHNITLSINHGTEREFQNAIGTDVAYLSPPTLTSGCDRILYASHGFLEAKQFLIVYGDDLTSTDYNALEYMLDDADAVLATTSGVNLEFGLIKTKEKQIKSIQEKPNLTELTGDTIWTGRVAMKTSCLRYLVGREDLARDVFPAMLKDGKRLVCWNSNNPWFDVGSISHWRKANEHYSQ